MGIAVVLAAVLGVLALVPTCLGSLLAGTPTHAPSAWRTALDGPTRALVARALDGLGPGQVFDHHVHLVGVGEGGTGAWVHPSLRDFWHPIKRTRMAVYAAAAGVDDLDRADSQYLARLLTLLEHIPNHGRAGLLAFDQVVGEDGAAQPDRSDFYVPNAWVFQVAAEHPDFFEPVMSIHPYRTDGVELLRHWAAKGGRMMKWLPNTMAIDPASPRCDPFYDAMAELGVTLLSHGGEEQAVDDVRHHELGNPLRLRRALDRGITVIVAHCASLGFHEDLDTPGAEPAEGFDLFLRLLAEPRYAGRIYGDISALTQFNRQGRPLRTLLEREDLHAHLVYGSDYPLPAVDMAVRTERLAEAGYLTSEEADQLDTIFAVNPLLFDLVLKRTLRAPGTDRGLPASVFTRRVVAQPRPRGR